MSAKIKLLALSTSIVIILSGCSSWKKLDNTEKGAAIGGGSGVLVGNLIAPGVGGTVVGGALGAVGGGLIGNEVDKDERKKR